MSQSHGQPEVSLTISAVSRRLGIPADTLRTWGRRYGLGPTEHQIGAHRRFSLTDVARLDYMSRLLANGLAPVDAARLALAEDVEAANLLPASRASLKVVADLEDENVISLTGPKASIRGLVRAANMMDSAKCSAIIANLLNTDGVAATWTDVLCPVLAQLGDQWAKTGEGIEVEHLIAEVVTKELQKIVDAYPDSLNARPVLLASAPHELHTLPLYAIAAGLAEQSISSQVLGARLPADALAAACKKLGPSAIVIWSQTQGTADNAIWDDIVGQRPEPLRMSAGPGWKEPLAEGVVAATDLPSTLLALAVAAGVR